MELFWIIVGTLMFVYYNLCVFKFASKILKDCNINFLTSLMLSIVNIIYLVAIFAIRMPRHSIYFNFFVLLCLEFKLISKAKLNQAAFGASVFILNICPIHLLTALTLAAVTGLPSTEFFIQYKLAFQAIFFAFLVLTIMLVAFEKLVPLKDITRVSKAPGYSELITATAIIIMANASADTWFLITEEFNLLLILKAYSSAIFSYIVFYYIFMFSRDLLNLHMYKRKSDEAENSYKELLSRKTKVVEKINIDELTGLYNRKYIFTELDKVILNEKDSFAVIFLDIAGLKYVNDTLGHKIGDEYILEVTKAIRVSIRDIDIPARIGGDEFLIILNNITENQAEMVVDRIKENLKSETINKEYLMHANMGIMHIGTGYSRPDKNVLIRNVDRLMREEKEQFYADKIKKV